VGGEASVTVGESTCDADDLTDRLPRLGRSMAQTALIRIKRGNHNLGLNDPIAPGLNVTPNPLPVEVEHTEVPVTDTPRPKALRS